MNESYTHQIWATETLRDTNSVKTIKSCDFDVY